MANSYQFDFEDILIGQDLFTCKGYCTLIAGSEPEYYQGIAQDTGAADEVDELNLEVSVLFKDEGKVTDWKVQAERLFAPAFVQLLEIDAAKGMTEARYSDCGGYLTTKGQAELEKEIWLIAPEDVFVKDEPEYDYN